MSLFNIPSACVATPAFTYSLIEMPIADFDGKITINNLLFNSSLQIPSNSSLMLLSFLTGGR